MLSGTNYRVHYREGGVEEFISRSETSVIIACGHDPLNSHDLTPLGGIIPDRGFGQPDGDQDTFMLVRRIAALVPVHVVRGLGPRGIIDYNRPLIDLADPEGSAIANGIGAFEWRAYHNAIVRFIRMLRDANRKPLLLDFHGFSEEVPYGDFDILVGTDYGKTVYTQGLVAQIAAALSPVANVFQPGTGPQIPGQDDLNAGGFTVQHYSSEFGLDAVQLEHVKKFRNPADPTGADALAALYAALITELNRTRVFR